MVIEDDDSKIPYKMILSKLVHQVIEGIFVNFCIYMTFTHYLISKNIILKTFFVHCRYVYGSKFGS